MNKSLVNLTAWFEDHINQLLDVLLLLLTVLFGTFIKIYKEPSNPNKWRFSRFVSEFLISFLIAVTLYQVNEMWLHFPKLFVMTLCVWGGSLSSKIYKEVDDVLSAVFESLKKFISSKFKIILLWLCLAFLVLSCKSQKPITYTQSKETNIATEVRTESERIKSLAILDSLKIAIEKVSTTRPECDSLTNAKIDELLAKINTQKSSGNNSYGFYFDKLKRELVAYATIGATQSENKSQQVNTQKTIVEKETVKIPVKFIPKWLQYLAWIGGILIVYNIYKIILWVQRKSLPLV